MKRISKFSVLIACALCALAAFAQSSQSGPDKIQHARDVLQGYLAERGRLPMAKSPEEVGFSSKRLKRRPFRVPCW